MVKHIEKSNSVHALPELGSGFNDIAPLFRAGCLPRAGDYLKLIEYVHYLHKLLGIEGVGEFYVPRLGEGLTVSDGVLSVDVTSAALAGAGLVESDEGLSVNVGSGLVILDDKVALAASSWEHMMGRFYGASHIAVNDYVVMFFSAVSSGLVTVHGFPRWGRSFIEDISFYTWVDHIALEVGAFIGLVEYRAVFQNSGGIYGKFKVSLVSGPNEVSEYELDIKSINFV